MNLRKAYAQTTGLKYTAPLTEFQRPTGRLDEHHFFAAAANQLRVFHDQVDERMPRSTPAERQERDAMHFDLARRIGLIDAVHNGYFNLEPSRRDHRTPFSGVMTRDVYTKAAHFILLREMLPAGTFRLITEQEGMLPRVLPVAFREEIRQDRLIWLATTFENEVKKPDPPGDRLMTTAPPHARCGAIWKRACGRWRYRQLHHQRGHERHMHRASLREPGAVHTIMCCGAGLKAIWLKGTENCRWVER